MAKLTRVRGLERPESDFNIATVRPLGPEEYAAEVRARWANYEPEVWFDSVDEC